MVNRNPKTNSSIPFPADLLFLSATKVSILSEIFDMFNHSYFLAIIFVLQHFALSG